MEILNVFLLLGSAMVGRTSHWIGCCYTIVLARAIFFTRKGFADNYLYCPASSAILEKDELLCFQSHCIKGESVIVRNILERTSGLSWEPMVMRHALCENMDSASGSKFSEVRAIDCLAGCEVAIEWKANTDGGINCAPSEMSRCGNRKLELKRIRDKDWISRLELRARNLLEIGKIEHALRSIIGLKFGIRCYRNPHPEKAPLTVTCMFRHQVQFWMKRSFYAFEVNGINVNSS